MKYTLDNLREESDKVSKRTMAALRFEAENSRPLLGSSNMNRLRSAISLERKFSLAKTSLLVDEVHAKHSSYMAAKFLRHWARLKVKKYLRLKQRFQSQFNQHNLHLSSSLRFMTVIHSVECLDEHAAFRAAIELKQQLRKCVQNVRGLSCLGALEVEVISMEHMRRIKVLNAQNEVESRKLDACEKLIKTNRRNKANFNDATFFLVHFHGILSAIDERLFDLLSNQLILNPNWTVAPRQIEVKNLSEEFAGKKKTTEDNLQHIARYITKGGNDWIGGKAYLRYKVSYDNDMQLNLEEWEALNWRDGQYKTYFAEEKSVNGLTDNLALTQLEVLKLANTINLLMSSDRNMTGYLLKIGKW